MKAFAAGFVSLADLTESCLFQAPKLTKPFTPVFALIVLKKLADEGVKAFFLKATLRLDETGCNLNIPT